MKVSDKARRKYMELCPISTSKCSSYTDLDEKIVRAAGSGAPIIKSDNTIDKIYYNLRIKTKRNKIIDIVRDESKYYHVSEEDKQNYTYKYNKIVI